MGISPHGRIAAFVRCLLALPYVVGCMGVLCAEDLPKRAVQWSDIRQDMPYLSSGTLGVHVGNKLYAPFMDETLFFDREAASLFARQVLLEQHQPAEVFSPAKVVSDKNGHRVTLTKYYRSPDLRASNPRTLHQLTCLSVRWEAPVGEEVDITELAQTTTYIIYAHEVASDDEKKRVYEILSVRELVLESDPVDTEVPK